LQLMQNIGKKRYAVAMSKVVASEEGVKKTRSLFEGLNVAQEDLIPVYYKQEIKLLMNGMKEQMLGQMFIEKQRLVRFLAVEQFLNQEANMFLKYRYREELFGISIIEGMACGCVPLTTDHSGPKEIITSGINGFISKEHSY